MAANSDNKPEPNSAFTELQTVINDLRGQLVGATSAPSNNPSPERIDQKRRKLQIQNDNAVKDQDLKEKTLGKLFTFLGFETAAIFLLAVLQGFKLCGFSLDAWSFRLLVAATIGQITAMLIIAVKHLFPKK